MDIKKVRDKEAALAATAQQEYEAAVELECQKADALAELLVEVMDLPRNEEESAPATNFVDVCARNFVLLNAVDDASACVAFGAISLRDLAEDQAYFEDTLECESSEEDGSWDEELGEPSSSSPWADKPGSSGPGANNSRPWVAADLSIDMDYRIWEAPHNTLISQEDIFHDPRSPRSSVFEKLQKLSPQAKLAIYCRPPANKAMTEFEGNFEAASMKLSEFGVNFPAFPSIDDFPLGPSYVSPVEPEWYYLFTLADYVRTADAHVVLHVDARLLSLARAANQREWLAKSGILSQVILLPSELSYNRQDALIVLSPNYDEAAQTALVDMTKQARGAAGSWAGVYRQATAEAQPFDRGLGKISNWNLSPSYYRLNLNVLLGSRPLESFAYVRRGVTKKQVDALPKGSEVKLDGVSLLSFSSGEIFDGDTARQRVDERKTKFTTWDAIYDNDAFTMLRGNCLLLGRTGKPFTVGLHIEGKVDTFFGLGLFDREAPYYNRSGTTVQKYERAVNELVSEAVEQETGQTAPTGQAGAGHDMSGEQAALAAQAGAEQIGQAAQAGAEQNAPTRDEALLASHATSSRSTIPQGFYVAENLFRIEADPEDLYYLFAYFYGDEGQEMLAQTTHGRIVKQLSARDVRKIPVPYPSAEKRREVIKEFFDRHAEYLVTQRQLEKIDQKRKAAFGSIITTS